MSLQGNDDDVCCCSLHEFGSRFGGPSPPWTCGPDSWACVARRVGRSIDYQLSTCLHICKPFSAKTRIRRSLLLCPGESRSRSSERCVLAVHPMVRHRSARSNGNRSFIPSLCFSLDSDRNLPDSRLLTLGAFLVNYRGIVVSSRVQLAVIV